jgi:glutathione peroxidase
MSDAVDVAHLLLRRIDGTAATLADYAGQVVLVVNVASRCGLTPQYESLQRLYEAHRAHGFAVLGFTCNQFREQEPGTDEEIQQFCSTSYGVTFPLFSKIEVNGPNRHPLYAALVRAAPDARENPETSMRARLAQRGIEAKNGDILWNFEKFLLGRDGRVVGRFSPEVTADDPLLRDAVNEALAAGKAG